MEQMPQEDFPRCQGISGTFIRPSQTFKEATAHIALSSPVAGPSSTMSIRKEEESSGGYFSYRPRSPVPRSRSVASECDREIAALMADADIMGNKGASRWRKVATTQPKSLWKPDVDAVTCDYLSTISGACEKPFGRFLGKYKLPSWSPSLTSDASGSMSTPSDSASSSSTSSLWGSIKTNRKTQCWRCGNCFCDDHSAHFATLILDREDAMPYFPAEEAENTMSVPEATNEVCLEAQEAEPDMQAPVPYRTATMALSQYLASSSQQYEASTSSLQPPRQQREQLPAPRTRLSSTTSRSSSVASDDGRSSFTGSDASANGHMDASTPASTNASVDCSPISSSLQAFPSKTRKESDMSSLLLLSNLGVRAPSPMSERMTQIPDGRIIVRERVCLRCHGIVESARSRALEKQASRRHEYQEFVSEMKRNGVDLPLDPYTGELIGEPDYVVTIENIFEEYLREKKKAMHAMTMNNNMAGQPSHGRHGMSRQQSAQSVHHSEDDCDDAASSTSGHSYHHYPGSYAYPNRAYPSGPQHLQHASRLRGQAQAPH